MDSSLIPKKQKRCIEEMVFLEGPKLKELLKFYFSNSLDDIQIQIYAETGISIDFDDVIWKLNQKLPVKIKNLMNIHNVTYSMTIDMKDKVRFVAINMRAGNDWFLAGFDEIDRKFCDWGFIKIANRFIKAIDNLNIQPPYNSK